MIPEEYLMFVLMLRCNLRMFEFYEILVINITISIGFFKKIILTKLLDN